MKGKESFCILKVIAQNLVDFEQLQETIPALTVANPNQ
jgi:hypothetical protein